MNDCPEFELIARAQAGDEAAEAQLVEQFEPFHHKVASQFALRCTTTRDDFLQEARVGTLLAVRRFDPARRGRLSTYVISTSRWYAHNEAYQNGNLVRKRGVRLEMEEITEDTEMGFACSVEDQAISAEVTAGVAKALRESEDIDDLDRAIIADRLAANCDESKSFNALGRKYGVSGETMRQRERRLKRILTKVLAEFR